MLSFKVKFEDFRILFRYSEQIFGNWLFPITIWLFGSGYTLSLRVWGVKWPSCPWSGSWGVTEWYQSQSLTSVWGLFGSVGVFVCLTPQSHETQWGRCVYMRGVCDVPHQIGEKVSGVIYVEAFLNQVDAF